MARAHHSVSSHDHRAVGFKVNTVGRVSCCHRANSPSYISPVATRPGREERRLSVTCLNSDSSDNERPLRHLCKLRIATQKPDQRCRATKVKTFAASNTLFTETRS